MRMAFILCLVFTSLNVMAKPDAALKRANGLLRFIAQQEGLRKFALGQVLGSRCSTYMSYADEGPCSEAVKKLIDILDFDIIITDNKKMIAPSDAWTPSSFVFVAFKREFTTLLSSGRTTQYMKALNEQLYKYLTGEKATMSIWDFTVQYYGNTHTAAQVLATLFQDTSKMKLHLAYLTRAGVQGSIVFQENKELLDRVIDTINLILDASEDHYRELFYPAEIEANLNRNIYHFYVPLYLASALRKSGISEKFSFIAPLFLTLSYEFVTSASDYRYLFSSPESIQSLHKIKDIFGGYSGANFALRGMRFNTNFTVIHETFMRSTDDGVQLLLRR